MAVYAFTASLGSNKACVAGVPSNKAGRPGMRDWPRAPDILAVALLRGRLDAVPNRGRVHRGVHRLILVRRHGSS